MKLDARTVAALDLGGKKDAIYFDEDMPGFGFRLRLGGGGKPKSTWIVQYRRAGATRRMRLGSGEVLSAEAARKAAKQALAKVELGGDPQAERVDRRGKDELKLRSVVDEYLAAKEREVRPKTLRELRRYLTGPAFKPLHGMPVDTVTRKDVASRLVAIIREHGSVVAARARAALSTFFVWAMQMGIVENNPIIGTIQPNGGKSRERVLEDDELAAIWNACKDDHYGKIVRLLILLGARRAEVGGMRWSELDLGRGTWTLPAERAKNNRKHMLPLMPMALDIIRGVPRMVSRDQLFGGRSDSGFCAWHLGKIALDRRSGVTNWTPHDIRRTVATRMADIGVRPHVIEQLLNHVSGHRAGVAGTYNRSIYEHEVRNALALWERYIALLLDRDLYAVHKRFLASGDEEARKRAGEAFRDAIGRGGGHWQGYLRTLVEGGERKVVHIGPAGPA
jgi:integrase